MAAGIGRILGPVGRYSCLAHSGLGLEDGVASISIQFESNFSIEFSIIAIKNSKKTLIAE
jgi:hypothetical protein